MSGVSKSRIRAALDKRGHTYRSIGERIGITPQAVCDIVNGRTEGATARYALAAALRRRVEDLWPTVARQEDAAAGRSGPEASGAGADEAAEVGPKARIRAAMEEQRHTYRTIAETVGVTPEAVSKIVNGRTRGATARYALASVLNLEIEELWPETAGGNGPGPAAGAGAAETDDPEVPTRRRKRASSVTVVTVSIRCPREEAPASVDLGIDPDSHGGKLTVLRCEHRRGGSGSVDCGMRCLSESMSA